MTKNIKLLLSASTVACFAISLLQGCGSDATNGGTPTAGAPGAGAPGAGAANRAGATGAGAPGAGAPGAGANGAGAPGGGAPGAGAGGASGGAGGAKGGAGGASGAGGAKGGAGGTSGAGGAGGAKGGAGGGGGASGGSAGAGGGSAGAGGAPSAACTTFCNDEESICTFTAATAAYASKPECLSACATFTPGTGTTGNTLACRQYHVNNANTGADLAASKKMHCPHTAKVSHNDGSPVTMANGPCN